jgi:DNA-directed RNA polymerase subunit H (RpoH/RPB5)
MEDNGYETARLKGVDVLGNVCVMLRQRGIRIVSVMDVGVSELPTSQPIKGIPSSQDHMDSESMVIRCASSAPGTLPDPIIKAHVISDPPPGSSAFLHLERGIRKVGDQIWVYMLTTGNIGIKQIRVVRESWLQENGPSVVIILSREKITSQAAELVRSDGIHLEKFLLSEISYNITRHFLVPKHWLLTTDETQALKKKYTKLALQARDDAISRYHGLMSGDVVAYHRVRLGIMGGIYYREVV